MNNLISQGLIKHQILGVFFAPPKGDNDTSESYSMWLGSPYLKPSSDGAITYGGDDPSLVSDKAH